MIDFPLLSLPRPKDVSPKETFKTAGKTFLVTLGLVALLALTIVWALITLATSVIISMVEQFTQPGPPKSKKH